LYGLDKIENNITYLQNRFACLERKIAYQLQDETHPTEKFYTDINYKAGYLRDTRECLHQTLCSPSLYTIK